MAGSECDQISLILIHKGGRERILAEPDMSAVGGIIDGPVLAWTPDSKWIACPYGRRDIGGACTCFPQKPERGEN